MSERNSHGSSVSTVGTVGTVGLSELAAYFERSVGEEKAAALVAEVCRELSFGPGPLRHEQARSVLDNLTQREGLIGIVAGFALGRLHFARTIKSGQPSGKAA